jgi:hypothetical protein
MVSPLILSQSAARAFASFAPRKSSTTVSMVSIRSRMVFVADSVAPTIASNWSAMLSNRV